MLGRLGRYELLSLIAKGGMGEVYLARTRGLGGFEKLVVIKRNLPALVQDHQPLLAEARLVATLQHTNIVQVNDVGTDDGTVFVAMEFLHGQDLRTVLRRTWGQRRALPLDQAIAAALSVCAGLNYAHDKRDTDGLSLEIVHRDVSPSNVFVTYDGAVKLIDFGIAKATSLPSETQLGTVKGKPGYMSPEQCRGEPLDRRSDLFCVGILLYELTTGAQLFRGPTEYATYRAICDGPVEAPTAIDPSYPPALEAIVLRALAKDRRERHATALALQEELAAFAVAQRLDVSQYGLGRLMSDLFAPELAAWHAAQQGGQSLAEHVVKKASASVPTVAEPLAGGAEIVVEPRPTTLSSASGMITTPAAASARRRRRRGVWIAAAAAIAAVAAVAAIAMAVREDPSPAGDEAVPARAVDEPATRPPSTAVTPAAVTPAAMAVTPAAVTQAAVTPAADPIVPAKRKPRGKKPAVRTGSPVVDTEPARTDPEAAKPTRGPDDLKD